MSPTPEWGPALVKHRVEAQKYSQRYDPGYIIDPWNKEDMEVQNGVPVG